MDKFSKFTPYLTTITEEEYECIGPHAFPIIVGKEANSSRDELVGYLEKQGVDSRNLFLSMPTQCPGFEFLGYKLREFPNAEYIGNNGFHIGIHQEINQEHIDYFIKMVEDFLSNNS